jgi:hypothetical protein
MGPFSTPRFSGGQELADPIVPAVNRRCENTTSAVPLILEAHKAAKIHSVLGRLALDTTSYNKCSGQGHFNDGAATEAFEVSARAGLPSLHYRMTADNHSAFVHITDGFHLQIESTWQGEHFAEVWLLNQPRTGNVTLKIRTLHSDGSTRTEESLHCQSLVHLQVMHTVGFRRHLLPTLQRLLTAGWPECKAADLMAMLESQSESSLPRQEQVRGWVEQLRSPQRQRRVEAEQQLIALGLTSLPLIKAIPQTDFEPEQRARLEHICFRLTPVRPDSKAQLSRWLVADIQYWNSIGVELTPQERKRAASLLTQATGASPNFPVQVADATR